MPKTECVNEELQSRKWSMVLRTIIPLTLIRRAIQSKMWDSFKNSGEKIGVALIVLSILLFIIPGFTSIDVWSFGGFVLGGIAVGVSFIAIGMAAGTDRFVKTRIPYLQGTVDEANSAELDFARNPQSGIYSLSIGTETDLYDTRKNTGDGSPQHTFFANAWIRLDQMGLDDAVRIRLYVTEDGNELVVEDNTYAGIQTKIVKLDSSFHNQERIRITAEQTCGSPTKVGCYVYDAARGN